MSARTSSRTKSAGSARGSSGLVVESLIRRRYRRCHDLRMKPVINKGRWTAEIEGDFVVFLIGARFERWHPIRSIRDLGGNRSMGYMLKYLTEHPEKGLLGYESNFFGTNVVQYWRSFEQLEAFAKDKDDPHLEPWRAFWKRVGTSGRSGI